MEKVIVCGNKEQAQKIQSRLSAQISELIILDLSKEGYPRNLMTGDAMFIAADNAQESVLLSEGIAVDRIINFSRFEKTSFENPIEKMDPEVPYTGLILGMSHSQCAIDTEKLSDQVYCNMAAPSMDIFCHLNYTKKLAEMYPDKLASMKNIIIELPYYIFNHDLSRHGTFVHTKLNYFEILGDYHNFGETTEQKRIIAEFQRFIKMFKQEEHTEKSCCKRNLLRQLAKKVLNMYRIATNKDKVWRVIYKDTVQENKKMWQELLKLLAMVCPNAKITVLIMPFNPVFRLFHRKEINMMKALFHDSLGLGEISVIDHFSRFNKEWYFDDHCHLNKQGAAEYIKTLQEALLRY